MAVSISISITQNSQNIANNTSNVTVKVTAKWTGGSFNRNNPSGWCKIDGTKYTFSSDFNSGESTSGSQTIFSKKLNISHNSDGTKTLACSASFATGVSSGTVTASKSKALTTIPRKSSLTVGDGTLGTAQTLTVTRQSTSFTHTIVAVCGSASATICTKSTAASISFTPPLAWASQNTTGTSLSVTYTITTYNGTTSLGSNSYTKTCSIPASVKPTVSFTVEDSTGYEAIYGGYVQTQSDAKIAITAAGAYGSSIKSYKTTVDGKAYTEASFVTTKLNGAGELTISVSVTDSRGRVASATKTITVLAYTAPKIPSILAKRCDANGNPSSSGAYLEIIFNAEIIALENKNEAKYTVEYKKTSDSSFGSKEEIAAYNGKYSVESGVYIFEADKAYSYDIILTANDSFGSVRKTLVGPSVNKVWSRLAKGLGFAFGKVAELEGYLDSGWRIFARKGLRFPLILSGADFNDMVETGTYPCGKQSEYKYLNCPSVGEVSFVLEVAEAGPDGEMLQRLTTNDKERPMVYERHYCDEAWGEWICVAGDYVVEQGTSGNWDYVKWNSGRIQLTGAIYYSGFALTTAHAGTYYGDSVTTTVPLAKRITSISGHFLNGNSGVYVYSCATSGAVVTTHLRAHASLSSGVCTVDYQAWGWWK